MSWPRWQISSVTNKVRKFAGLTKRRLEDTDADKIAAIHSARAAGTGIRRIAKDLGVGVGTVLRVTSAP